MTSTNFQNRLLHQLTSKKTNSKNIFQKGFTLVELMVVIVIVGILSGVALPQFLAQTKKAAATEASQIASSITKQAAAEYLYDSDSFVTDASCIAYAGAAVASEEDKFDYVCSGDEEGFVVTATGDEDDNNTKGVTVTMTSNLKTGILGKPRTTEATGSGTAPAPDPTAP